MNCVNIFEQYLIYLIFILSNTFLKQLKTILFIHNGYSRIIAIPMVITVIASVIATLCFYLFKHTNVWEHYSLGVAGTFEEFCEHNRMDELFREPVNTISNLSYLLFGAICLSFFTNDKTKKNRYNLIVEFPEFSLLMGLSFIWLCFGSFFYHASLSRIGQQFDMAGTYAVCIFPLVYNLLYLSLPLFKQNSLSSRNKWAIAAFFLIILLDVLFFIFKWQLNSLYVLPAFIIGIIITTYASIVFVKGKYYNAFLFVAVLSCLLAFALWYADKQKIWCMPYHIIQGHALWHFLTGFSAFNLYLFLRSTRKRAY